MYIEDGRSDLDGVKQKCGGILIAIKSSPSISFEYILAPGTETVVIVFSWGGMQTWSFL